MLRVIDIPKLAYQLLRPNYALTSGGMETVNLVSREYIWAWNSAKEGVTDVVTSGADADGTYLYVNWSKLLQAGLAATNASQVPTVPDCFGGQIKYKPNTPYVFKARIKQGAEMTFRVRYEDGTTELLSAPPAGTEGVYEVVHTINASRVVQKIYMYVGKGVSMYIYDIQLTDGSKVYQPPRLNTLYRFVLSLLFPLSPVLESWDRSRRKSYAIAACQYGLAQVLAILNKYYGQYGQISIQVNSVDMVYFYTAVEEGAVPVYMYSSGGANTPTYFYTEGSLFGNSTTVVIPKELADSNDYDDFIADLNAMLLYGIKVKLKIV